MSAFREIDGLVKQALWPFAKKQNGGAAPKAPPAKPPGAKTKKVQKPVQRAVVTNQQQGRRDLSNRVPPEFYGATPLDRKDEAFGRVYDFYRDIAPGIRMKQLGVEKLPDNEQKAFDQLSEIPVMWSNRLQDDRWGEYHPANGSGQRDFVLLNGKKKSEIKPNVLAHELRHALEKRMPSDKKSTDFLQDIFGYIGVDIAPKNPGYAERNAGEEMFTTNKEHQFRVYNQLRDSLKRAPTAQEYFDYVKGMKQSDLYNNHRKRWVNGYQQIADEVMKALVPRRVEQFRKGLMEISRNGRPARSGWGRFVSDPNGGVA